MKVFSGEGVGAGTGEGVGVGAGEGVGVGAGEGVGAGAGAGAVQATIKGSNTNIASKQILPNKIASFRFFITNPPTCIVVRLIDITLHLSQYHLLLSSYSSTRFSICEAFLYLVSI